MDKPHIGMSDPIRRGRYLSWCGAAIISIVWLTGCDAAGTAFADNALGDQLGTFVRDFILQLVAAFAI